MERNERGLTDLFLDPATVTVLADLVNLEPLGGLRVELVARRVSARGHVGQHWAFGTQTKRLRGAWDHDIGNAPVSCGHFPRLSVLQSQDSILPGMASTTKAAALGAPLPQFTSGFVAP